MRLKLIIGISLFLGIFHPNQAQQAWKRYEVLGQQMGSPFRMLIWAQDSLFAHQQGHRALDMVESMESELSDYRPKSALSILNAHAGDSTWHQVSPYFEEILGLGERALLESNGKLNIYVGAMVKVWRKARAQGQLPDSLWMQALARQVQSGCLQRHPQTKGVRLSRPACQVDLGALGKGFVAQKVSDSLKKWGLPFHLIDAGGKLVFTQAGPSAAPWRLGLEAKQQAGQVQEQILAKDQAMASSGSTYQYWMIGGRRYSHVLDPWTGWPLRDTKQATALYPDGGIADWLATAATLCDAATMEEWKRRYPGLTLWVW